MDQLEKILIKLDNKYLNIYHKEVLIRYQELLGLDQKLKKYAIVKIYKNWLLYWGSIAI